MKVKKHIGVLLAVFALLICTACTKAEPAEQPEPEEAQLKSICQLSALEGYFHNVLKYEQEGTKKFFWTGKGKRFWLEYTGIAKYGLDASKVKMELSDNQVTVTLPKAELLYCKVDSTSIDENSYIVDGSSAKITAEDGKEALTAAQNQLEEIAENYEPLITMAQQQAQSLMEAYIKNIVSVTGKDAEQYTIRWNYLDE